MKKTKWNIAKARQELSKLLQAAASEPQPIYKRNEIVAVVIDPKTFEDYRARTADQGPSIGDAFASLRKIAAEEKYTLKAPARRDRKDIVLPSEDESTR